MRARPAWLMLAAFPLAAGAMAQTTTRIDPDSDPTRSLGTSVASGGNVHVIDGGTRAGANLFHSFARFDLGQGDTARWVRGAGDGASIANVVNRVTGGLPSFIEGTIDSTALPNADFWFINPSGILFGAGARLDVPAAAHFSTASELRFDDGPAFAVTTPSGSTFSVAPPAAFGFDGGQGAIRLEGAGADFLPATGELTLAGSEVAVTGSDISGSGLQLLAVGDEVRNLALAGSPPTDLAGPVVIDDSALRLARSPAGPTGIRIGGGVVIVAHSDLGTPFTNDGLSAGGPIEISGGDVEFFSSLVSTSSYGTEDSGDITIRGGDVRILGHSIVTTDLELGSTGRSGNLGIFGDSIRVGESRVTSSTQTGMPGGSVVLAADSIVVSDGSVVGAEALPTSTGNAGSIFISGQTLDVGPVASITSSTSGPGSAGAIEIDITGDVRLVRGRIGSSAETGADGAAGMVSIRADGLELHDQSGISTGTDGAGDAGFILIETGRLLAEGASQIESRSSASATGNAGLITLLAEQVTLSGGADIRSDTAGAGNGGGIFIQATDIALSGGAQISSDSLAMCWNEPCGPSGAAGGIAIIADRLSLTNASSIDSLTLITSVTRGEGNAGTIDLLVGALELTGAGALIGSDTFGSGRGGTIRIDAASVALRQEARLSTGAFGDGAGGTIDIVADSVLIEQQAAIMAQSSEGDSGPGGSVVIRADTLVMRDVAEINTNTRGGGQAGTVDIVADRIALDRSFIGSDSIGPGAGGSVSLAADEILLAGGSLVSSDSIGTCGGPDCERPGDAGSVSVKARLLTLAGSRNEFGIERSSISSQTFTEGDAGDINVTADEVRMEMGEIVSGTQGDGAAGTVTVNARILSLADRSRISTSSAPFCFEGCATAGNAGAVKIIVAESLSLTGSEVSSNTSGPGNGGQIAIGAGVLDLAESTISSSTTAGGDAGEIAIDADSVRLGFLGEIESLAASGSVGDAGSIAIKANEIALDGGSIGSSSFGAGRAGTIAVAADRMLLEGFSQIGSSSGGEGDGGSVSLAARELFITGGSKVLAEALGCEFGCARAGSGGSIRVNADILVLEGTDDEFGGQPAEISSSTFAGGTAGDVSVTAEQISLNRGNIASETFGSGPAGTVNVTTGSLSLTEISQVSTSSRGGCEDGCPDADAGSVIIRARDGIDLRASQITSVTRGAASAGSVDIIAGSLIVDLDSQVSSGSELGSTGGSGTVLIDAGEVALNGGVIGTISTNTNPAGNIRLRAQSLLVADGGKVSSENISERFGFTEGDAGTVSIEAADLTLREGGSVSTSSDLGAAGDIVIAMPEGSILRLEGNEAPGTITTSSGPGTGGRIIIANPYAIISDGGSILALGEQGGANVQIQTDFFITSADTPNLVAVDGSFLLEAQVGDMSRGTVERDLSVLDASGVLRGQCAAVRETGQVSQLVVRPVGPLGVRDDGTTAPPALASCL